MRQAMSGRSIAHRGGEIALLVTLGAVTAAGAAWAMGRLPIRSDTRRPRMRSLAGDRGFRVERTVTVMRRPDELYARWRDLEHLPEFMPHLDSVTRLGNGRSRWAARGPGDIRVTWEAELTADEPGRLIAWRSVEGADVDNAGSVTFEEAPGNRGTEVKVRLSYAPPAGALGGAVATLLGKGAGRQVREDLRLFKQRIEAGEVATSGRTAGGHPAGTAAAEGD